jgi:hypothetical protein
MELLVARMYHKKVLLLRIAEVRLWERPDAPTTQSHVNGVAL